MATQIHDRSLGALFGELMTETTTLVRKEIELARAEMSQKVDQVQSGATSMAVGGAILYAGFLVLLLAAVVGLDAVLDQWWATNWLAPLIVGLIVVLVGYVLLQRGRSNVKAGNLLPQRTFESLRRDRQFARAQVR